MIAGNFRKASLQGNTIFDSVEHGEDEKAPNLANLVFIIMKIENGSDYKIEMSKHIAHQ